MTTANYLFDNYEQYEMDADEDLFDSIDLSLDDDDHYYRNQFVVKIANIADGAQSLADVADMLRGYADMVEELDQQGFALADPVFSGTGFAYVSSEHPA